MRSTYKPIKGMTCMSFLGKTAGRVAQWSALFGLLSTLMLMTLPGSADAAGTVKINVNLAAQGPVMQNKHSMINVWDFRIHWTSQAAGQPSNYFASHYPL